MKKNLINGEGNMKEKLTNGEKTMKESLTEVVFILDRSGSMSGLEKDTIGGFNSLIKKQKKEEGMVSITTVLFDDRYELLHDNEDVKKIKNLTEKDYFVRGSTALLDAVGKTINDIDTRIKKTKKEERADKILFVITTDGMENASREFKADQIKEMIEKRKKGNWEFLFLGANIDAIQTARMYGIDEEKATNYVASSEGTKKAFRGIGKAVTCFKSSECCKMSGSWKEEIDGHFKKEKKNKK